MNLIRLQRAAALRVIRDHRTVSNEAALLLVGIPTTDLLCRPVFEGLPADPAEKANVL